MGLHSSSSCLAVFVVLLSICPSSCTVDYDSGNIGCLYTMEVCKEKQICMDDSLFGVCSDGSRREIAPVSINVQQALELEHILTLLVTYGYPWQSAYVQCIVKAYLVQIEQSPEKPGFPTHCNKEEQDRRKQQRLQEKLEGVLEEEEEEETGLDSEDEFVDQANRFMSYRTGGGFPSSEKGSYLDGEYGGEVFERVVDGMDQEGLRRVEESLLNAQSREGALEREIPLSTEVNVQVQPHTEPPQQRQSQTIHRYEAVATVTTTHAPLTTLDLFFNFYRSSTRPFYKSFHSIPDPPSVLSKEKVRMEPLERSRLRRSRQKYLVTMYILCGFILMATFLAVVLYFVRRRAKFREKFLKWMNKGRQDSTGDYQDLCRQHMQSKMGEKVIDSPMTPPYGKQNRALQSCASFHSPPSSHRPIRTPSTNSSSSSWNDEPINSNLDISTGHLILSYMEDHIKDKDRLQREWDELSNNDPEPCSIVAGIEPSNMRKNRCTDIMPYEHTRVRLDPANNVSGSDYINANFIVDNDPRNPTYIITQGPLPHTVADFWQMVWEQNSVVIVNLTRLVDSGTPNCHRYWPEEGTELYHIYEVQLISEHVLCEDFVVRSLVLKCIQTTETRTVTQFHLTCWSSLSVPPSTRVLLDFRRKVNKSYRSRLSPIVVHCGDGAGRSGTYCLIDMTLNRLNKGAKEMNIAAGLEHLRDQRVNLVRTKDQFEYALTAIADEVQTLLNVPQM